jgi:Fe2+ transport system protein FeoA
MQKKLSEFELNETGTIVKVDGEGKLRRRIFDMGVTPGAKVKLIKKAPLGDPLEINIRGYELTLRKIEADIVTLEMEEN